MEVGNLLVCLMIDLRPAWLIRFFLPLSLQFFERNMSNGKGCWMIECIKVGGDLSLNKNRLQNQFPTIYCTLEPSRHRVKAKQFYVMTNSNNFLAILMICLKRGNFFCIIYNQAKNRRIIHFNNSTEEETQKKK